jgi:hypothetical protein
MGACSIKGGNVGGIPDREQRSRTYILSPLIYTSPNHPSFIIHENLITIFHSEYFDSDPTEHEQGQAQTHAEPVEVEPQSSMQTATDSGAVRGRHAQQAVPDNPPPQPAHNLQTATMPEIGFISFPLESSRALILFLIDCPKGVRSVQKMN